MFLFNSTLFRERIHVFLSNKEMSEHFADYEDHSHKFWELRENTFSQNILPTIFHPLLGITGQMTHIFSAWLYPESISSLMTVYSNILSYPWMCLCVPFQKKNQYISLRNVVHWSPWYIQMKKNYIFPSSKWKEGFLYQIRHSRIRQSKLLSSLLGKFCPCLSP